MRTLLITAILFGSSFFSNSYAEGTFNIHDKLEEVVKFKNGTLPLEKNRDEFVKVSFKINEEGKVEILEMNYSDEIIKKQLIEKLSEMKIEENHDPEEIYYFNFTFKKF
jgi:hypothetical protein